LQTDLARSLRRIQPERFRGSLPRRDGAELDFADAAPLIGPPLLLDTCVYVDALEGALPPPVEALLRTRTLMHLSVVLGALSHNFGRLDPGHPNTGEHLGELAAMINDIRCIASRMRSAPVSFWRPGSFRGWCSGWAASSSVRKSPRSMMLRSTCMRSTGDTPL